MAIPLGLRLEFYGALALPTLERLEALFWWEIVKKPGFFAFLDGWQTFPRSFIALKLNSIVFGRRGKAMELRGIVFGQRGIVFPLHGKTIG